MPHDLPKAYDPTAIEDHWAEYWVREELFAQATPSADQPPTGETFTVLLPPPNVTGNLHMGHMFEHTESDILVRWRRMRGDRVLWVPGTDHAGIATQMLVERQVVSEGTTREQMGREAFLARVWEWRRHYGGAILGQMRRIGDTVDWKREYFTMSDELSVAVREAFVRLYEQGLIYRGAYIVNWCPSCRTAISDLEVVYDEHRGSLWEIRYPVVDDDGRDTDRFLTVATTRPETMLGDVAVAVHPADERYLDLHGRRLRLPLVNRIIPVVTDEWVSPEFGTGAVKVTPAHDPNDFALGQRHSLPSINVMDEAAHINENGGSYRGLERGAARSRIVSDLEQEGLLAGIRDHLHNVGHCDRCKTVVEPRLSLQWFVKIQPLADRAIEAVRRGYIRFTPAMYEKTYLNWMENIHDWCISRQLWWGHRIPAWHCGDCGRPTVARTEPGACAHCGSGSLLQETDVLDTWFSSGLLPVSVFGWPDLAPANRADFDAFYPTSLMVTGFDILFFWVARMIMLGCWFAADVPLPDGSARTLKDSVPFRDVYIHALVRDANREKMSKTKGNVVNPIEIVRTYGTDAVRFTLAAMASPGTDIAFNVARTEGYRAFANKIWNAARFLFLNVERAAGAGVAVDRGALGAMPSAAPDAPLEARWIVSELHQTSARVARSLEEYRFDDAANAVYQFFWAGFCDWYLEIVKLRLEFPDPTGRAQAALTTLVSVFEAALRLLSPFMPFLTEELWHAVYDGSPPARSIALSAYPLAVESELNPSAVAEMELIQSLVTEVRGLRRQAGVEERASLAIEVHAAGPVEAAIDRNREIVERLARISEVRFVAAIRPGLPKITTPAFDVALVYERTVDTAAERERLGRDLEKVVREIQASEARLNNPGFTDKAPAHIVDGLRRLLEDKYRLRARLNGDLEALRHP